MEDEIEVQRLRPDAQRVVRRAWCLSAIVCRAFIDEHNRDEQCVSLNRRIIPWLQSADAECELETWEAEALAQPMGTWELQKRVDATWMSEGLLLLVWALGSFSFPRHDVAVDPKELTDAVYFLNDEAKRLLDSAQLLDVSEIDAQAERAFAIHWRLRQFSLDRSAINFAEFARTAWFGPLNLEGIELADNDLAIKGVAIAAASHQDFFHTMSIARERHRAANWLIGYDPIFSEVDTST